MAKRAKTAQTPADAVDAQLARYREMRDFATTAEPRGASTKAAAPADALPFVIQKHAATRLHYDFRLGWHGVLKSWAVAKGPSHVVADKRLAVQVEDHPMEYGGFEGAIPKGQYGGGTVMLWDTGTWEPVGDADEGLRTGRLKFILHGKKLKGHWTLVRMGGKAAKESKPNWLLIKEHDEYERAADALAIVDEAPDSVITERSMDAIAKDADHVWNSNHGLAAEERAKQTPPKKSTKQKKRSDIDLPQGTKAEALPGFVPPQLASAADSPPKSADWVHELKLDGYRTQARFEAGKVQLLTRSGLDWTHRMRSLADTLQALPAKTALLDGEVIVLDEHGISSFSALQASFQEGAQHALHYYVFDLLHLNGHSLRDLPLLQRKELLKQLIDGLDDEMVRFGEHIEADGADVFDEACSHGAEGVVSKRIESKYISGRSTSWVKAKCGLRQELVIGGFTLPSNGSDGIGALLLGYYEGEKLIYAGRTGTGFTQQIHKQLRKKLDAIRATTNPFLAVGTAERRGAHWVKPELVAEVAFSTWTADNFVRQAAYKGLREDKPATEVVREVPAHAPAKTVTNAPAPKGSKMRAKPRATSSSSADEPLPLPRITHPEKILDRESGLTKQQLVAYYAEVAPHMLAHIAERPLSIVRCPSGTAAKCFFQKHVKQGLPTGIRSVDIADRKGGKPEPYIVLSDARVVPELGQLNVLEFHPWGAPASDFEHPDRIIFDLDPDAAIDWPTLAATANTVRERLQKLGLESFLKSTGGKGLHIVAPIECDHDWITVKTFAHQFVLAMEAEEPRLYITKMTKAARSGRIYLDYLRNERGATAVAPFSPRSRAGVPVSVPMAWSELKASAAPRCLVARFAEWKKRLEHDPWADLPHTKQHLTASAIASVSPKKS